jgi:archaellum component FlaF (FlaF/FlaG flagellin family)
MRFWPFIAAAGILSVIVYGISRTVNASRLIYLIQNASESSSQLALLVTVSNNQGITFTQNNVTADVLINGQVVSQITDSTPMTIPPYKVTPQAWMLTLPASAPQLQLVRIRGTININGLSVPLDLNYKFI